MIVHIKLTNGCYFHMGKVKTIREDEGNRVVEISRASESPAVLRFEEIASIRVDMPDQIASAAASFSDLPPAA